MKFLASSGNLLVRYTSEPMIPPVAQRYMNSPVHPIRPKIAYMYEHRDPNTLWWRVSVSQLNQFKRTVRSWCARRARLAFQEALRRQGFDKLGRPLTPPVSMDKQALLGSLDVTIRPSSVYHSFEAVQKDADFLLKGILKQRERWAECATHKDKSS
ncbi:uncharacterized protein N7458_008838 [Penicillium daleae]|jgi:hypothetical protein|uniref:Uncharacterized protein n=1 Tax=Penicillium daleae TaxID=63821 RepID=A0AAD6BWG4_9EURO|nr:uncharacterized protein N7458_008838 [Penicillium daleae]KAJ5437840.1 hypothetical protein N7458_008838 [Penicillium daleae]